MDDSRFLPAIKFLLWLSCLGMPVLVGCASSGGSSGSGGSGGVPVSTAVQIVAGSGTLTITPATVTIHPGDQNLPINVSVAGSTYSGPIYITLTDLPSGITFTPLTLTSGGSGTLDLSASASADQEGFNATEPLYSDANSSTNSVSVVGVEGSGLILAPMALTVSLSNPSFAPAASQINLPIVTINTSGAPITSKTVDVPGTITITSANGKTSYLPNSSDTDDTATFHVHGHSEAAMPKLPYDVKLNTSVDLLNTMGLACPYVTSGKAKPTCDKSKTYVLIANYDDKTFLRDWSASALANAIPIGGAYLNSPADSPTPSGTSTLMPWATHSLFVELYVNGAYEGTYQLIEKVNVDAHRININELAETDVTDDITGGYLLEIDHYEDEAFVFQTPHGVPIGLDDPDFSPDSEVPAQTTYISNYVDSAENALFASDFTDPTLGWRAYFDQTSAVNFYIVNEVMGNVDGGDFYSSNYFYKNTDNPLLYMGPVWDFDYSSGNASDTPIMNPTVPWVQVANPWYPRWFQDPVFKAAVTSQWNALKNNGVFTAWLASINQQAAALQQSQANNFARWPMLGIEVWPNSEAAGSYDGELGYYTNWLNTRIAYLDSLFNNKAQTSTALTVSSRVARQGVPFQLSAHVSGQSAPTGSVSFLSGAVLLGAGAIDGSGNVSMTVPSLPAGSDALEAVYEGDAANALSASSSISVAVSAPLNATTTALSASASNTNFVVIVLGVSGTASPSGTVTFTASGQLLGSVTLAGNGSALFSPTQLPAGATSMQAAYSGDATYQSSSATLPLAP
jgi:hypothetical protein